MSASSITFLSELNDSGLIFNCYFLYDFDFASANGEICFLKLHDVGTEFDMTSLISSPL